MKHTLCGMRRIAPQKEKKRGNKYHLMATKHILNACNNLIRQSWKVTLFYHENVTSFFFVWRFVHSFHLVDGMLSHLCSAKFVIHPWNVIYLKWYIFFHHLPRWHIIETPAPKSNNICHHSSLFTLIFSISHFSISVPLAALIHIFFLSIKSVWIYISMRAFLQFVLLNVFQLHKLKQMEMQWFFFSTFLQMIIILLLNVIFPYFDTEDFSLEIHLIMMQQHIEGHPFFCSNNKTRLSEMAPIRTCDVWLFQVSLFLSLSKDVESLFVI